MLTDKHIGQWSGYLVEEFDRRRELEKILIDYPEFNEVFLAMYKKGYEEVKNLLFEINEHQSTELKVIE